MLSNISPVMQPMIIFRELLPYLVKLGPRSFRRWVVERYPDLQVQKAVGIVKTIHKMANTIVETKKQAADDQIQEGKDILSRLSGCTHIQECCTATYQDVGSQCKRTWQQQQTTGSRTRKSLRKCRKSIIVQVALHHD